MRAVYEQIPTPIPTQVRATDLDPAGFGYAAIRSIADDHGAATVPSRQGQPLGTTVDTYRTLCPGDRVIFRCRGNDSHGRELRWWLHPQGGGRHLEVRGENVELSWIVQPGSVGDRVYAGVGMAADSRYHRHGGRDEEGYDGWVVFYYRVQPVCRATGVAVGGAPPHRPELGEQSRTVHVSRLVSLRIADD